MIGAATRQQNKAHIRPIAVFDPLPWQIAPWRDQGAVILLTGSAGGGKSRLAAEKLHGYALKYPGTTALLVRKARVSITNSTAELLRRVVIGDDPRVAHVPSKSRFEYRNGSTLMYTGLDDEGQRQRLRSIGTAGGVDIAWLEEATEFEEEDYNAVLARLRGQAASWRQIILSTNPDAPTHWIYRRLIVGGEAKVYYSAASDNTHNPGDYQARLSSLTGTEGERLARGQWVQATGLIYDVWSDGPDDGNVTETAEYIPDAGPVVWACDDGYAGKLDQATNQYTAESHPRVFLLAQLRHNGRICIFAEHYAVQAREDTHIEQVLALGYPEPDYAVVDKSAATLKRWIWDVAGVGTYNGPGDVEESIKTLRSALAADANGWRRVLVHPRCRHLRAEMASYRRDDNGRPVKAFDHGPDSLRYLTWHLRYE